MKKLVLVFLFLFSPLFSQEKVLAFSGSLRKDSLNKKLVQLAAKMAQEKGAEVTVIDLKDYPMPFYDADIEKQGMPPAAKAFRDLMVQSNAVIIASPQYNDSISGVLKNAIDWASRSEDGKGSKEAFKGKKFAIMSASPSKKGGAVGLAHLRAVLTDCGGAVLPEQVTVGNADTAFTPDGDLASADFQKQLTEEISALLRK